MVVTLDDNRDCGCCGQAMRKLTLAAHYHGTVEIDVCEPCMLIWFDGTESTRLAGPGLIELLRLIRDALAMEHPEQPQPILLTCPVCVASLQRAHNLSRFGRTTQMQCPDGHGYYQSFMFFLAEKGYYRRYLWADIRNLADSGRSLECICCGATLELQPVGECPYCGSSVGLIDPARLASAVDIQGASGGVTLAPAHSQVDCAYCGSRIDPFRDDCCPCCRTPFRPMEADGLSTVTEAVEQAVGEAYRKQAPILSRRLLDAAAAHDVAHAVKPQFNLGWWLFRIVCTRQKR